MVKIKREKTPKLLSETNKAFKLAIAEMDTKESYNFFLKNKNKYKYNTEETKNVFEKMNKRRCSFCTGNILNFRNAMTVEHIRPKKDYPKYIYEWDNLLCSCSVCNNKRSTNPYDENKYLDPTKIENIEEYFCFDIDGKMIANDKLDKESQEKANYMINLYKLNEKELVSARKKFLKDLIDDDEFYKILKNKGPAREYILYLSVFEYYSRGYEKLNGK